MTVQKISYVRQLTLFDIPTEAKSFDEKWTQRALDELFSSARQYRSSKSFKELLTFITRFRFYSPYNAMLLHIQMPGARYVAPGYRWIKEYGRIIKPNARPLVILQPMGPVMFIFDVADTEPGPDAKPLPPEVEKPFEVRDGKVGYELERTIENSKRDGISIQFEKAGSQSAGSIFITDGKKLTPLLFQSGKDKNGEPVYTQIPVRYTLLVNENLSREAQYATIVHELAHLYCGHLGTPNVKWWPDRRLLSIEVREFEAESLTYLVCNRLGIVNPSDKYLSGFIKSNNELPNISIESVMKSAGLIEQMGSKSLKLRKDKE
jgi:hypothetical protein